MSVPIQIGDSIPLRKKVATEITYSENLNIIELRALYPKRRNPQNVALL